MKHIIAFITLLFLTGYIFGQEPLQNQNAPDEEQKEKETFYIVGDSKPIAEDSLFTSDTQKAIILDAFNAESESRLGRFEIPKNNETIIFYVRNRKEGFLTFNGNEKATLNRIKQKGGSPELINENKYIPLKIFKNSNKQNFTEIPEEATFKSIGIELIEGSIVDARLILENENAHFYFEITTPVSILHFSRMAASRNYLKYSHYVSKDTTIYDEKQLELLQVKLIDVLDYHPNTGSNHVPDNVSYDFPSDIKNEASTNKKREYRIINNTRLQHVLDLRAYTDALGLFSDEANGLFQIEGKADFFIHPFNFPRTALYYFKKVSPYARYSRLDDDEDFLNATLDTISGNYSFNSKKLDLLQRSNLEMGLDVNLLNFRSFKESPFWVSLRFPLSYHVTPIITSDSEQRFNFKTIGYGIAADIELKRFNNFGLNLGYELKGYSYLGSYSELSLEEPDHLKTQALKAEIFYYPNDKKSQSLFFRMKSIRDLTNGQDAFFQLQFGYRFTIGIGSVKAK